VASMSLISPIKLPIVKNKPSFPVLKRKHKGLLTKKNRLINFGGNAQHTLWLALSSTLSLYGQDT